MALHQTQPLLLAMQLASEDEDSEVEAVSMYRHRFSGHCHLAMHREVGSALQGIA